MKKFFAEHKIVLLAACILAAALAFIMTGPAADGNAQIQPQSAVQLSDEFKEHEAPGTKPTSVIAFSSDTHIQPGAEYHGELNPLFVYNRELTQALLADVEAAGADYLILCGDLTNAGRVSQHKALVEILNEVRSNGVTIYVIPGNHDQGEVNAEMFAELYAEYGFNDAYSRDKESLSYSLVLPDQFLLMLDTGGYTGLGVSGDVTSGTIAWAETQLAAAAEMKLPVITVGHYPLLTLQSGDFAGGEELLALLLRYEVPLYVCGHMHGRSVSTHESLTELVVEQIISYPCSYALVKRYSADEIEYEPHIADIQRWAENTEGVESLFFSFDQYREAVFAERCRQLVRTLKGSKNISERNTRLAEDFYVQFQQSLSHGRIYRDVEALRNHEGYKQFIKATEGTVYNWWVDSVLESPRPYTSGFLVTGGGLYATAVDDN